VGSAACTCRGTEARPRGPRGQAWPVKRAQEAGAPTDQVGDCNTSGTTVGSAKDEVLQALRAGDPVETQEPAHDLQSGMREQADLRGAPKPAATRPAMQGLRGTRNTSVSYAWDSEDLQ
jgi:hypothetical protein